MTTFPSLENLRPAPDEKTAAGIRASLDRVAAADYDAEVEINELKAHRGRRLLTSSAADIAAGERGVTEIEIYREQLAALTDMLRAKLVEQEKSEARAPLAAECEAVTAEAVAIAAELRDKYPPLAAAIADLLVQWHRNNLRREAIFRALRHEAQRQDVGDLKRSVWDISAVLQNGVATAGRRTPFPIAASLPALPGDPETMPYWSVKHVDGFAEGPPVAR